MYINDYTRFVVNLSWRDMREKEREKKLEMEGEM